MIDALQAGAYAIVVSVVAANPTVLVTLSGLYAGATITAFKALLGFSINHFERKIKTFLTSYLQAYCNSKACGTPIGVSCIGAPYPQPANFRLYIDPSGTVLDTNGNPIAGATVTILRGATSLGPFSPVDPTGPDIEPAANPETTGSDGVFHWDVVPGEYEIAASAPGCYAPGNASRTTVTSAPLPVPPPQVGLVLPL